MHIEHFDERTVMNKPIKVAETKDTRLLRMCAAIYACMTFDERGFELIWQQSGDEFHLISLQGSVIALNTKRRIKGPKAIIFEFLMENGICLDAETMKVFPTSKLHPSQSFLYDLKFPKDIVCNVIPVESWKSSMASEQEWNALEASLVAFHESKCSRFLDYEIVPIQMGIEWLKSGNACEVGCVFPMR
jgi:hypothetical protein